MPAILDKPAGKRGKMDKSDAHNLLERLQKHEASVLLFAMNALVPFTNNRGERDLRMSKVKQKVSGCFRSEIYSHAYCCITSYLQTMAYKGVNPMIAIQMALAGEIGANSYKYPLYFRSQGCIRAKSGRKLPRCLRHYAAPADCPSPLAWRCNQGELLIFLHLNSFYLVV